MMNNLINTLSAYQLTIDNLPDTDEDDAVTKVLNTLTARDDLARFLNSAPVPDAASVNLIRDLDRRLKESAPVLDIIVGREVLADWRESIQPASSAWWWSLDRIAAQAEPEPSPWWAVLTGFFVTMSFALVAELGRRFLTAGTDVLGVFSTLFQGTMVLFAGSTFTTSGNREIERTLLRLRVKPAAMPRWKSGLALLVLLLVIGFRLFIPLFADYYNRLAETNWKDGDSNQAVENYLRAIDLNSGFALAHFNLGNAYEKLLQFEPGASAFQNAIRADARFFKAYIRLSRLELAELNNPAGALSLLNSALALNPTAPAEQYELVKNRGWAQLNLANYSLSQADLQTAQQLRPEGPAAYCLLGQLLEIPANPAADIAAAQAEWEQCLTLAQTSPDPMEAVWLATAQERVSGYTK
jgi:hypothetical protein